MKKVRLTPVEPFRPMMRVLDPQRLPLDITPSGGGKGIATLGSRLRTTLPDEIETGDRVPPWRVGNRQ